MKYTIKKLDYEKGHVTFEMEDGISQTVCDCPMDSAENTEAWLFNYAVNYVSPKIEEKESVAPVAEVQALVGKTVDVDAIVAERKAEEERLAKEAEERAESLRKEEEAQAQAQAQALLEAEQAPVEEVETTRVVEETEPVAEVTPVVDENPIPEVTATPEPVSEVTEPSTVAEMVATEDKETVAVEALVEEVVIPAVEPADKIEVTQEAPVADETVVGDQTAGDTPAQNEVVADTPVVEAVADTSVDATATTE